MILKKQFGLALVVAGLLSACGAEMTERVAIVDKTQLSILNILATNKGKRICVEPDVATNSCQSIIESKVAGNTITSKETAAFRDPATGKVGRIQLLTKSRVENKMACANGSDVSVARSTLSKGTTSLIHAATVGLANEFGGFCGEYYQGTDSYVVRVVGRNGVLLPPGNLQIVFFDGKRALRTQ